MGCCSKVAFLPLDCIAQSSVPLQSKSEHLKVTAHTSFDRQQAGKTPASVNFFQNSRNTFLNCYFSTLLYFSTKNWLLSRSTKAYRSAKLQKIGSKNAVSTSPEKCTETVNLSKLWKWVYSLLQFSWMWMIKRLPLTINERSRWIILSHYF